MDILIKLSHHHHHHHHDTHIALDEEGDDVTQDGDAIDPLAFPFRLLLLTAAAGVAQLWHLLL